ncbi:MAG: hypothetical protein D6738_06705 [Acidobacteria bacterium]|nr:MAG: hypothetical protein D6738_06705 [Acidobacteriota bacterium]
MADRTRTRRSGWLTAADVPPPQGAPPAVWAAVRRARLRAVLGGDLGVRLVEARRDGGCLVLVLAGSGWKRALAGRERDLAARATTALGARIDSVRIVERPDLAAPAPVSRRGAATEPGSSSGARLRAVAERLLARRDAAERD